MAGWRTLGPAEGEIVVPSSFELALEVEFARNDLAPLALLPSDALTTLDGVASVVKERHLRPPVVFIIGDVAAQTDRVIRLKDGKVLSDVRATGDQKFLTGADLQGVIA